MYSFLFHVKFKGVIKVLGTSFCLRLVHLSVRISRHLNSSYPGSSVDQEDYIKEINGTGDVYDEIDSPTAVSNYNAASGLACTKEEPSLGRASSPSDEAHLTGSGLKLLLLHHDDTPVKTEENPR